MSTPEKLSKVEISVVNDKGKAQSFLFEDKHNLYDSFAKLMREERMKKNMSQQKLAKLCGFTTSTYISSIENGRTNPSEKVMVKIAKILGLRLLFTVEPDRE